MPPYVPAVRYPEPGPARPKSPAISPMRPLTPNSPTCSRIALADDGRTYLQKMHSVMVARNAPYALVSGAPL